MSYLRVKNLESTEFKRLCGVTPATFEQMVKVVAAEKVLAKKSGRPSKLSIEGKDSGLKSLSAIDSRYAFGSILLNILQIIFSITEPQTL